MIDTEIKSKEQVSGPTGHPLVMKIEHNSSKVESDEWYLIVNLPKKKIYLSRLPLEYEIQAKGYSAFTTGIVDLGICKVKDLGNDITELSHGMGKAYYIGYLCEKYPGQKVYDRNMLIVKFKNKMEPKRIV